MKTSSDEYSLLGNLRIILVFYNKVKNKIAALHIYFVYVNLLKAKIHANSYIPDLALCLCDISKSAYCNLLCIFLLPW